MSAGGPPAIVVGTGFGLRVHAPALRAAGFDVTCVVGRDAARTARRAERAGVGHSCPSLDAALDRHRPAAVTVATPPATHAELVVNACAAGAHVLCEKPFAPDAEQAARMVDAANANGVGGFVGHEFRWATDRAVARRAIAAGVIGEPRIATFVQHVGLVTAKDLRLPDWWYDSGAGGGWLGASGSHSVDLVRSWLGEFASVSATLLATAGRGDADDTFTARFGLVGGVEGVLQETAAAWGPGSGAQRVTGTAGTLWLDGGQAHVADADGVRTLPVPADLALPSGPAPSGDPRHRFTHLELGPFTRLAAVLLASVHGEDPPGAVPVPTFAEGLANTRVLDAIRESAAAGGVVVSVRA